MADKISLDNTSQTLYTPDELHWMSLNFFENGYEKRTWIVPAIEGIFLRDNQEIAESHNFNDPFIYTVNQTDKELEEKLRDHPEEQQVYITFPRENNRQKTALTYFVRELQDGGTKVAIVIMPLNPLLEPTVNETNSQGMREFLNTLGVPVVDLESAYGRSDFIDFVHMNSAGREEFSRTLAEDILPD